MLGLRGEGGGGEFGVLFQVLVSENSMCAIRNELFSALPSIQALLVAILPDYIVNLLDPL